MRESTSIPIIKCSSFFGISLRIALRFYYEKTKFPTVYGDAIILNPRAKLAIFEEETWEDIDAIHYTNGCRRRFLDTYVNSPSNTASDSTATRPTIGNRSAQAAFHDDVEYQELIAQRSSK